MGEGGGRRGSGSRWRRGPFPKRPEGFVSLACSDRQPPGGPGGPAVGRGARRCEPWSCSVGHGPLARGSVVCLRSAAHVAEPLRALPGPACTGGDLTPGPGFGRGQRLLHPLGVEGAPGGKSEVNVLLSVGGSGGPGRCARVRPRGCSPARPLARPGWAGQHHPTSSSPHRRRCGCHRLVEELDNPNARRDDFVWSATRPAAQLDPGHPDRRAHRRWGARDDPRLSRDTQISYAVP